MIDFISSWAGQLVAALMIASLIEMLVPKGKNKKYIKMLIGIYIIFCIISPFVNINESFSVSDISDMIEQYGKSDSKEVVDSTSMDKRLEEIYLEELENTIINDLSQIGYKVAKCKIDANLNSKISEAGINSITLKVKKENQQFEQEEKSSVEKIEQVDISINNAEKEDNKSIEKEDVNAIKKFIQDKYEIEESKIHISG